ncbi:MAG TPA: hypothetical protein VGI12_19085 [Vicinamibacterales bacterium]|jgi:hypothetical protein
MRTAGRLTTAALALSMFGPRTVAAQSGKGSLPARVEFRAIGDEGQIVTDLKAPDLALKVNGKPHAIRSLTVFAATTTAPASPLPPPYSTNTAGQGGRIIHVLIDDDSIAPGRESQVRDAIRILSAELAPTDRLGVLTPQGTLNIPPTTDLTKVRLAVNGLTGRAATVETDQDAQCRTTHVFRALGTMIALAGDAPTTIAIFSGGVSPPSTRIVDVGRRDRTIGGGSSAPASALTDMCPVRPEDLQNIGSLASVANLDFYLLHMSDALPSRSPAQDAGFESLAGATGARYIELPKEPQTAVSTLLRETAAYYVATFDPEPGERTGQPQRLELTTTRDKVKLRTRPAILIPRELAAKSVAPRDLLRVASEYRDLPLRSTAYASRMPGGNDVRVVALFEPIERDATIAAASVGLFDGKGTLKAQWTAQKDDLARRPMRADLQVPPGMYRVRVAALDTSGRSGTTDDDVTAAPVRADPLTLSALVIGTRPAGGGFAPRLEFTSETVAIGLVELYNVPAGVTVAVSLDVASTPEGPALAAAETTIGRGGSEDARTAIGGFAIEHLPAGDYLMRAVVTLDGKPVGKVVRALRKAG